MEINELVFDDGSEINNLSPSLRREVIKSWRKTINEQEPMVFDLNIETYSRYMLELENSRRLSLINKLKLNRFASLRRKYIFIYERPVWEIFGVDYNLCEELGYEVMDYYVVKDIYDRNIVFKLVKKKHKVKFVRNLFALEKKFNGVKYLFAVSEGIITASVKKKRRTVIEHYGISIINTSDNTMYTPNLESGDAEYFWDKLTEKEIKLFGINK